MDKSITSAAKKAIESGVEGEIIDRCDGGHICQSGYLKTKNGKVIRFRKDCSFRAFEQIRSAKVVRISWDDAMMNSVNA